MLRGGRRSEGPGFLLAPWMQITLTNRLVIPLGAEKVKTCKRLVASVDRGTIILRMKRMLLPGLLALLYVCSAAAQNENYVPETPVVKSAEMPLYPHLARVASIQGTVQLEVTTDGVAVTNVKASAAHKLLVDAAVQNVSTWQFYTHKPQTFTVTFIYELETPEVYGLVNPTV